MGLWESIVETAKKYGENHLAVQGLRAASAKPATPATNDIESTGQYNLRNFVRMLESPVVGPEVPMQKDYIGADRARSQYGDNRSVQYAPNSFYEYGDTGPRAPTVSNRFGDIILNKLNIGGVAFPPIPGIPSTQWNITPSKSHSGSPGWRESATRHERVHSGQYKYGIENLPTPSEMDKTVFGDVGGTDKWLAEHYGPSSSRVSDAMEAGAAIMEAPNFSQSNNPKWPTNEKIFNYLDLVFKKNPAKAPKLEAYVPDPVMKQYIQDRPRPIISPGHREIMSR